jgi:hypothetical protein
MRTARPRPQPSEAHMGIGRDFQEGAKYIRGKIAAGYHGTAKPPGPFKTYHGAPAVVLVPPAASGGLPHRGTV